MKNGTTVNLDDEDDDHGRQAFHLIPEAIRLPRPI
jgi:hypothetical protein